MRILNWLMVSSATAQLSIIDLFQPQALGLLVSTMVGQFEQIADRSNLVQINAVLNHLGDMTNEELVELFNEPAFAALNNPNNWDYDVIADLLGHPITAKQLRDAYNEILGLISANQVDELNDAFISLVELVYEAQNVLETGFNTEEIIGIGFDMLNTIYNFNYLFQDSSFDTYLFGVGSYLFLMAEKYLLVTNELENSSFGTNLINLYSNFTDVTQGGNDEELVTSICKSLNKGVFPALEDLNSFVVGVLSKSGSDLDHLISYWNQLVANLPFDEFVTINLYNQCHDSDILERSIHAVESKLTEMVRYAKLASWPFYPLLGIVQVSLTEALESATGYNCNQLIVFN